MEGLPPGSRESDEDAGTWRFGWVTLPGSGLGTPGYQHWSEMVNEAFGLRNAGYNGFFAT